MSILAGLRHRLNVLFKPSEYAQQVDDEIRFHMDLDAEHQRSEGTSAEETPFAVRRRFGRPTQIKEDVRDATGFSWFDAIAQDIRYAVRTLRRSAGFTLVAVLTLAIGIGSTTAMFGLVDSIVLRGLPYGDADRIQAIYETDNRGGFRTPSYPTYADYQSQIGSVDKFVDGFAFVRGDGIVLLDKHGAAERRVAAFVTPGFFDLLGNRPVVGRSFSKDEEREGARVAMLSWDTFVNQYAGDRAIIGKVINVDSTPTTVIGVMPHGFAYPNFTGGSGWTAPALWQPIALYRATHPQLSIRGLHVDSRTLLRLKPGVDPDQAKAALGTIATRIAEDYPAEAANWTKVEFQGIEAELFAGLRKSLIIVFGAIAMVLLLACVNVATLWLVRASARSRELAVRSALGGNRWRLARQLLVEATVLGTVAGAAGLGLAWVLIGTIRASAPERLPFATLLHVDGRIALFAVGAAFITSILIGLAPAVQAGAGNLMSRMRSGGSAAGSGRAERRFRHLLVSFQFALALTMLVGAGLLLQSFRRLASVPMGFDASNVIHFSVEPPKGRYAQPSDAAALWGRIIDAMKATPGVTSAAAAGGALIPTTVATDAPPSGPLPRAGYHPVSSEYLSTMRLSMIDGRWFTDADMRVASGFVVNERLAKQLWPGVSAIGKRITVKRSSQARADFGQPITLPVIGVIGDMRQFGPETPVQPEVMLPYTLEVWPWMNFNVRATDAATTVRSVERIVRGVEPGVNFLRKPRVLNTGFAAVDAERRYLTYALSGFAGIALLLAAIGLYSVVAYGVVQRTRELGIRIALGAQRANVVRLVLRDSVVFVIGGAVLGGLGASMTINVIKGMLFNTPPTDPATIAAVVGVLVVVAGAASYGPALRATRSDPLGAIRAD